MGTEKGSWAEGKGWHPLDTIGYTWRAGHTYDNSKKVSTSWQLRKDRQFYV